MYTGKSYKLTAKPRWKAKSNHHPSMYQQILQSNAQNDRSLESPPQTPTPILSVASFRATLKHQATVLSSDLLGRPQHTINLVDRPQTIGCTSTLKPLLPLPHRHGQLEGAHAALIRPWEMPAPDVYLQALVHQPRRGQLAVAGGAHLDELPRRDAVAQVPVARAVLGDRGPGPRGRATRGVRVVVARPDAHVVGERQQHAAGPVQRFGGAAGEVAPGCAEGRVEERVAAEDVV
ncbi:hypothetical protein VTK26DRAFT_8122 [Humicola hyalothermophila]